MYLCRVVPSHRRCFLKPLSVLGAAEAVSPGLRPRRRYNELPSSTSSYRSRHADLRRRTQQGIYDPTILSYIRRSVGGRIVYDLHSPQAQCITKHANAKQNRHLIRVQPGSRHLGSILIPHRLRRVDEDCAHCARSWHKRD
ncbi:hypothetical protein L227DRAFT_239913 [Lentinus tigrinus ALCF2SS1-6]|uniref:Uncharacterized protein n=1 Tax=Lentinus tigrinus ALCF2SS1-6 TaxID=1328759 RepID=A0A5C2S104_9APHY|nr:hypothetical protein L227DRAFT_239913 [Lentinus tigrinus ALCF2SS1-6]